MTQDCLGSRALPYHHRGEQNDPHQRDEGCLHAVDADLRRLPDVHAPWSQEDVLQSQLCPMLMGWPPTSHSTALGPQLPLLPSVLEMSEEDWVSEHIMAIYVHLGFFFNLPSTKFSPTFIPPVVRASSL